MAEYGIWLSWNNQQEGFRIPINPARIELGDRGKTQTYDVVGLGEVSVLKGRQLTEFAWSSEFPGQRYPWVVTDVLPPSPFDYVAMLLRWWDTKRPIRFVFVGPTFEINEAVSIEDFRWSESAGAEGDIAYTIRLKRYQFFAAQRVVPVQPAAAAQVDSPAPVQLAKQPPARPDERVPPATYTLAPGDTLWMVAQRVLGDGSRWREIQELNGISDAEVKRLPVGLVLRLPGGVAVG